MTAHLWPCSLRSLEGVQDVERRVMAALAFIMSENQLVEGRHKVPLERREDLPVVIIASTGGSGLLVSGGGACRGWKAPGRTSTQSVL